MLASFIKKQNKKIFFNHKFSIIFEPINSVAKLIKEMRGRKGAWTSEEEEKLRNYVNTHGPRHWNTISKNLDIGKSGNSCRLKWVNYLNPHIRRGELTNQEISLIIKLRHQGYGWSKIAKELGGGRTDNDIKNFWHSSRRVKKEAAHNKMSTEPISSMVVGGGSGVDDTFVTSTNCPTGQTTHAQDSLPAHDQELSDKYNDLITSSSSFWDDLETIISYSPL